MKGVRERSEGKKECKGKKCGHKQETPPQLLVRGMFDLHMYVPQLTTAQAINNYGGVSNSCLHCFTHNTALVSYCG